MSTSTSVVVASPAQHITATVADENVTLCIPTQGDQVCTFAVDRAALAKMHTAIEAKTDVTVVRLKAAPEHEVAFEVADMTAASTLVNELKALKQLLGRGRWKLSPIKAFAAGSASTVMGLLIALILLSPTSVPQAAQTADVSGGVRVPAMPATNNAESWTP